MAIRGDFKDVSRIFHCCLKFVSWKFRGSLKGVSRMFQGCFYCVYQVASMVFQECLRGISKVFSMAYVRVGILVMEVTGTPNGASFFRI